MGGGESEGNNSPCQSVFSTKVAPHTFIPQVKFLLLMMRPTPRGRDFIG